MTYDLFVFALYHIVEDSKVDVFAHDLLQLALECVQAVRSAEDVGSDRRCHIARAGVAHNLILMCMVNEVGQRLRLVQTCREMRIVYVCLRYDLV